MSRPRKRTPAEGVATQPNGIALPGVIKGDGSIEKGRQNLESSKFNLPATPTEAIPQIGEHDTRIMMHNDGVVQGLNFDGRERLERPRRRLPNPLSRAGGIVWLWDTRLILLRDRANASRNRDAA
jgi:hypothetical protein